MTIRLTRVRDNTALSPRSCIRSRRSGAAFSSSNTSSDVELSDEELTDIENAASKIQVQGGRYSEAAERATNL